MGAVGMGVAETAVSGYGYVTAGTTTCRLLFVTAERLYRR